MLHFFFVGLLYLTDFPGKIKEGVTFEVQNIDEGQKLLTPH